MSLPVYKASNTVSILIPLEPLISMVYPSKCCVDNQCKAATESGKVKNTPLAARPNSGPTNMTWLN